METKEGSRHVPKQAISKYFTPRRRFHTEQICPPIQYGAPPVQSNPLQGETLPANKKILGRPQQLYNLNELKQSLSLRGSYYSGIQVVPISSIIGSEGRTADFDMDFHPLSESARERWVNIAIAHLAHIALPPIQLIQVGRLLFRARWASPYFCQPGLWAGCHGRRGDYLEDFTDVSMAAMPLHGKPKAAEKSAPVHLTSP